MEFHEYETNYECAKRFGCTKASSAVEFYRHELATVRERFADDLFSRGEHNKYCEAELVWYRDGRPYYKLWPGIIPLLGRVGVEVPVEYLKMPFRSFVLRFPRTNNPLRLGRRTRFSPCWRTRRAVEVTGSGPSSSGSIAA